MKHPDLNLLLHFDALMSCRSITRAAEQLGVTQPALSAAMSRLRRLFNDPLLVRDAGVWQPTARALELHQSFRPMLEAWRRATRGHEHFDPAHSARTLSLYATDYVQYRLLPLVIPSLARDAPHLHLQIQPARPLHGLSMLDTNHVELIAGYFPEPSPDLRTRFLYEEPAVCIVREGHPCLRKRWNLDAYLRYSHVDLAAHTRYFSRGIDRILQGRNRSRHIAATLSSYLVCPFVISASDLIATMPASVARVMASSSRTVILKVPMELPTIAVSLYWHERHQDDPGHAWLRQYIAERATPVRRQAPPPQASGR
ncbi:LysR family transcriptional regulator [Bordetella petrii]|uniref:LysR family transcriptional regulator n=1 Tax=Bordetella petrii TaxID=94624 RepID=UPI001A9688AF|nr:LysR family transcriptional regulator [Bordetella petrii]MBO1114510.1 LysR family transcriptional regulator [Bordetella petrii]